MANVKLTPEIKAFIDENIASNATLNYSKLAEKVAEKYGVRISKATISKRVKALKPSFRLKPKPVTPLRKRPSHSISLDWAGAFFLKGAELETGLLTAINQLLVANADSVKAKNTLRLARQLNALLLYAPIFGLEKAGDMASCKSRTLGYLMQQQLRPSQEGIEQYLHFLNEQKLLPFVIKEVRKSFLEALVVRIDFVVRQAHHPSNHPEQSRGSGKTFYLDAQSRTVWASPKVPQYFSTTLNKTKSYIKDVLQEPSAQQPLILQAAPGYTFLPEEVFNFIQCFEQAEKQGIAKVVTIGKNGENLAHWQNLKARRKCFFIFPLNPWQYARLQGTRIIKGFQQYQIGPEKEIMQVADARIKLFNSQHNENIKLRAALVRRKQERLALVTNISFREERYIRRIADRYFSRWPGQNLKTYYDLLEEAHKEALAPAVASPDYQPAEEGLNIGYKQRPQEVFRLFLERLHQYALKHFFPPGYRSESLKTMCGKFYSQSGYLKMKQNCWDIMLHSFAQKDLSNACRIACGKFNQSAIKLPTQKPLHICLQPKH